MKKSLEEFRMEFLLKEIEIANLKINHFDVLRLKTKQLAITLWIATLGFGLKDKIELLYFMAVFIPLPFWLIDTKYRQYASGWNKRFFAIGNFIRNGKFKVKGNKTVTLTDFITSKEKTFPVPDFWAGSTISDKAHKESTGFIKNFSYRGNILIYLPMIIIPMFFIVLAIFKVKYLGH